MPPAAALTISPEVEREIVALKSGDPRPVDIQVIDLKHARQKNNINKTLRDMESLLSNANARLLAFRHLLRGTLARLEGEWSRSEVATYRGAFVDCVQEFELRFDEARKMYEDAKASYAEQVKNGDVRDAHTRRFMRNSARTLADLLDERIRQQNRMIDFMRSEVLVRTDRRLRVLNKPMSLEESVADVTARYPKVLEYLAQ